MAEIQIEYNDRRIQYTADGGETGFIYDFPIYQSSHLIAKETDALGVVSTLMLGTDYTLTGVGDEAGGNLVLDTGVYPSGATADHIFTLYSQLPEERLSDYSYSGDFTSADVNKDFDSQIMMLQQLRRDMTRSPQLDITDELTSLPITVQATADRQDRVVKFSPTGDALEAGPTTESLDVLAGIADEIVVVASIKDEIINVDSMEANIQTVVTNIVDIQNAEENAQAAIDAKDLAETAATTATTQAGLASGYANAAAQSAAEGMYGDVVSKAFADSPIVPLVTEEGTLFKIDTSGGNVVVNLSALSSYAEDMKFAFVKITADANTVTINRGGTDTIDGATSIALSVQYQTHALIGDSATGTWSDIVQQPGIADNAVTTSKILDGAVTYAKLAAAALSSIAAYVVGAARTYTGAQRASITALTSTSAHIAIDLAANNDFSYTFTENTTLDNPSNVVAGQSGAIYLTQHASSPKTLAFGSYWDFKGSTAPSVTATNSARDTLFYTVRSATQIEASIVPNWG